MNDNKKNSIFENKKNIKIDLNKEFPNRNETKEDVIYRRKNFIYTLFNNLQIPIRLIGNPNTPAILMHNKYILSAYVHNFELNFVDKPYNGNILYTLKLNNKVINNKDIYPQIIKIIGQAEHRTIFKIQYKNTNLFLSGYTFVENFEHNKDPKYMKPVFSHINPKVYFDKNSALDIINMYINEYDLEII